MSTHTEFKTHLDAARTALVSGDYFTAERECVLASLCLAAMPLEAGRGNQGDNLKTREMEDLKTVQSQIRVLQKRDSNQANPLWQTAPLEYASPQGVSNAW
jgi:hypothetical protein